jgi:hypothetical protein
MMMMKRLLIASFTAAAMAPLAAQAYGGVSVSVSTPEFGFHIGGPVYGSPAYVPVYVPPPPVVYAPVYAPPVVYARPVIYGPVPAPRVIYRRAYLPPPRVVVPYGHRPREHEHHGQQMAYWVPPGHARRD